MVCCSSSFCESCISNYLKTHSSVCPECETKVSFNPSSSSSSSTHPNNNKAFIIDDERRKRSDDYIQEILKISQAAQLEQAKSNEDQTTAETSSSKPALDALEADTNSKREGESQSQASKVDESSPKPDQSSQPKDDSKSLVADKSDVQSNVQEAVSVIVSFSLKWYYYRGPDADRFGSEALRGNVDGSGEAVAQRVEERADGNPRIGRLFTDDERDDGVREQRV